MASIWLPAASEKQDRRSQTLASTLASSTRAENVKSARKLLCVACWLLPLLAAEAEEQSYYYYCTTTINSTRALLMSTLLTPL
jgi:hypothetical protein